MADIMMCGNDKCEQKEGCLRYIAIPNKYGQSYLADPVENCEENDWILFVEAN